MSTPSATAPRPDYDSRLLWTREAELLHDHLAALAVVDPQTGERFTVRRIDDAIQLAVETATRREGWRITDIFGPTWRAIAADVAQALGVDADALDGVAL